MHLSFRMDFEEKFRMYAESSWRAPKFIWMMWKESKTTSPLRQIQCCFRH